MTKKNLLNSVITLSGILSSAVAMAAEETAVHPHAGLAKLGAAIAIGLGAFGVASGQGRAASSAMEGIARNPTSRSDVFIPLIISLAFMEFLALLCFIVALMLLG